MASIWQRINQALGRNYVSIADGPDKDAFNRIRVSQTFTLLSKKLEYYENDHDFPELVTGTGSTTYLTNQSAVQLNAPADGDSVIRQSHAYEQYQPGNSQLIFATGAFGDHQTGITKRVGMFDDKNGIFFEQSGGDYHFVIRTNSGADGGTPGTPKELSRVSQSSWNIDTLKVGSKTDNPSFKRIDFTKTFILIIDLEWLGVGRVRIGFVQDGVIYYAHEFVHAGYLDRVYMSTASLPLRYQIINSGGVDGTMVQICSTIKSEGGQEVFGVAQVARRSFYNAVAVPDTSAGSGAYTPIISIRPIQTFKTLDFRGKIKPIEFEVFVEGNFPIEFILVHDGALTGASWTQVTGTEVESATEYDISATAIDLTNAHVHNFGFAVSDVKGTTTLGTDILTEIFLCNGIDITDRTAADVYTIAARAKGGTPDVSGHIRIAELY